MNAFHVIGAMLALWALIVSFLGITREHFPGTKGAEQAVAAITVVLVIGAIGSAILTASTEGEEEDPEGGEAAALVLPR